MPRFDLATEEGLRAACEDAESRVDAERASELAAFLEEIRKAAEAERATKEFQRRIWTDTRVWDGGLASDEELNSILKRDFRVWFAKQSVRTLPESGDERTEALSDLFHEVLDRAKAAIGYKPWVESLRTMALVFPEDFSALCNTGRLVRLARDMNQKIGDQWPVWASRMILDRLDEVIGSASDGLTGTAGRMLMIRELGSDPKSDDETPLSVVRAGAKGEDEPYVLEHDLAVLGFTHIPGLGPNESRESLDRRAAKENPEATPEKARMDAGSVWMFARTLSEGDIVMLPQKRGERPIAWGRVAGPYAYREIEGRHRHTRPVRWVHKAIPREDFPEPSRAFDLPPTIYPVHKNADRIRTVLLNGGRPDDRRPSVRELWETLSGSAKTEKLRFDQSLVEALHLGLWADEQRHFAVLSGLSGTGKTQIALRYAMALTGAESDTGGPVEVISVHPGWHDPGPLLGYVNPLTGGYTRTEFLNFLLDAGKNPGQPHVLILDEMNLSHPEQYFAPILSAMEIRDGEIPLHREDAEKLGVPTGVSYPSNLVIIGTVNMDETTMGISDKVLDRAFTLEFWDIEPEKWPGWDSCKLGDAEKSKVRNILVELTKALSPARRHFGWRVIKEVVGFLEGRSKDTGIELTAEDALDQVIYAKVLPKLRGSDTGRFRDCLDATLAVLEKHGLGRCAEKVKALKEDLEATGSCSFWR